MYGVRSQCCLSILYIHFFAPPFFSTIGVFQLHVFQFPDSNNCQSYVSGDPFSYSPLFFPNMRKGEANMNAIKTNLVNRDWPQGKLEKRPHWEFLLANGRCPWLKLNCQKQRVSATWLVSTSVEFPSHSYTFLSWHFCDRPAVDLSWELGLQPESLLLTNQYSTFTFPSSYYFFKKLNEAWYDLGTIRMLDFSFIQGETLCSPSIICRLWPPCVPHDVWASFVLLVR